MKNKVNARAYTAQYTARKPTKILLEALIGAITHRAATKARSGNKSTYTSNDWRTPKGR